MTKTLSTVVMCATLLWAGTALATATPAQTCAAAKQKAAGQKGKQKLTCYAKYTQSGGSFDVATCLAKAEATFAKAFHTAEFTRFGKPRGCATTGDAAAIEALVDDFVAAVVGALPAVPAPTATPINPPPTPTATLTTPTTIVAMLGEPVYFTGSDNRRTVDVNAMFPALDAGYGHVVMHFALRCPAGGCDAYDRLGSVSVVENPGAAELAVEISRFITPFGVGAAWDVDVTDLYPLLAGNQTIRVFIDTWVGPGSPSGGAGWLVDVSFEYTPGTPARRATAVLPVFAQQQVVYGDPARSIPSQIPAASVSVPSGAASLALRTFVTGHGQGNADNCAEFCQQEHTFNADGTPNMQLIWRTDCATTAAPGQMGTYAYSRAGWCPGAVVHDWTFDVPLPADGTVDVGYDVASYENTCRPDATVCVGCTLGTGCAYDGSSHTEPFYDVSALLIVYE